MKRLQLILFLFFYKTFLFAQVDTSIINQIKRNFQNINSTSKWTRIDTLNVWGQSAENGDADVYFIGNTIKKITEWDFGETGRAITEYYLLNDRLSFIFNKEFHYNRPLYEDTIEMKKMNDTEAWDFKKSKVIEKRFYYNKDKLVEWIDENNKTYIKRDSLFIQNESEMLANFKYTWGLVSEKQKEEK